MKLSLICFSIINVKSLLTFKCLLINSHECICCDDQTISVYLQAITTLVKSFPGQMNQWMPQILSPVWHTLTTSADVYPLSTVVTVTQNATMGYLESLVFF